MLRGTDLEEVFHLLTELLVPLDIFLQRFRSDKERVQLCLGDVQR